MNFQFILNKFESIRLRGERRWQAKCPNHDDRTASLSIEETDTEVLLHCHAGCKNEDILRILDLELKDLFKKNWNREEKHSKENRKKSYTIEEIKTRPSTQEVYDYRDKKNNPYMLVVRQSGKNFLQYSYVGFNKYKSGLNGQTPVPYKLPEILKAMEQNKAIFIVEGEKDVHTLMKLGFPATTAPAAGSGSGWKKCFDKYFKGARIIILPDNDEAGEKYKNAIVKNLHSVAHEIRVIYLPGLPEKGDITDWMQSGNTKEQLIELVKKTEKYQKSEEEKTEKLQEVSPFTAFGKKNKLYDLLRTEEYLTKNFEFRLNIVTVKAEIKDLLEFPEPNWKQVTDNIISSLYFKLQKQQIDYPLQDLRQLIINPDFSKPYDPFLDYFNSLDYIEDGKDYITEFTDCFILKDERLREKFRIYFKKWFVGILTGVYSSQWCNHCTLVVYGEQGDGKTTILNKLIPPALSGYLQIGGLDLDNKDTIIAMCSKLLINVDELESFTKKDIDEFKSILTQKEFDIRLPYGHFTQKFIKRASFMASTNKADFLTDTTGNRRFLTFEVISVSYEKSFNIDKMYAQAKYLYQSGFKYYFTKDEIMEVNTINEKFSTVSIEEELLLKYFIPASLSNMKLSEAKRKEQGISLLSTTDIAEELVKKTERLSLSDKFVKKLGSYLRKHNFQRIGKQGRYVYGVKSMDFVERTKEDEDFDNYSLI